MNHLTAVMVRPSEACCHLRVEIKKKKKVADLSRVECYFTLSSFIISNAPICLSASPSPPISGVR